MPSFLKTPILIAGLALSACAPAPKAAPLVNASAPASTLTSKTIADESAPVSVLGAPETEIARFIRNSLNYLGYTKTGIQSDGAAIECEIGSDKNMTMQMAIVNSVSTINGGNAITNKNAVPTTDSKLSALNLNPDIQVITALPGDLSSGEFIYCAHVIRKAAKQVTLAPVNK